MIEFADRFWLYVLPIALVLVLLLFQIDRKGRRLKIRKFASDRLIKSLLQSYSPQRKKLKNILLLIAVSFLFLSLARPQWGHTWTESTSRGIDIVFALDSSRSMLAQDIRPNRLVRAKLAIEDFVGQLEGDRIGLVAFSGSAFLQCPLTLDYDAFLQSLNAVDTTVISAGGTDLSAALRESESAFSEDNNYKIVVLITDGEDLEESGVREAQRAAGNGVTVYAVGVGTAEGSPIPIRDRSGRIEYVRDESGQIVQSRLDETTLTEIAETTGGFYVPLGSTGFGLEQVLNAGIGSIPEEEISSELQRTAIERFQWPLAIALFLLLLEPLIGSRRGWRKRSTGVAATLLICLMLVVAETPSAMAQIPNDPVSAPSNETESIPLDQLPDTQFSQEIESNPLNPVELFNRGTALYGEGQYKLAEDRFKDALRLFQDFPLQADTFYNLGNTRYQQGRSLFSDNDPAETIRTSTSVSGENQQPIAIGRQILENAPIQVPPQDQLQQAISLLEQRQEATEQSVESLRLAINGNSPVESLWQRAINDYESTLELTPTNEDALHNLEYVKQETATLSQQTDLKERLEEDQQKQIEELEYLIEELKKLLEQQENEDQQNEDQQDQDQEDQNQSQDQQQNQDSGSENQQDENEESSSEQSNQPEEDRAGEENNSDQQDPESEQSEASDENEQQSQAGDEQTQESETQSGDGEREQAEEQADEQESSESAESQASAEQEESISEENEAIELSDEQANEIAEEIAEAAASAGEEGDDGSGEEIVVGVMSQDDAARLLDSLKNSERKLPFAGSGSEGSTNDGPRRNW
ncbi:MAG: VWA domain-containing protein [Verrucomicrobiota bacterium]